MLLSCYFDDDVNFKIFLGSTSKAMADREKRGEGQIQNFEYLKNQKSFLDQKKNIVFERLSFGKKIADTSFNE